MKYFKYIGVTCLGIIALFSTFYLYDRIIIKRKTVEKNYPNKQDIERNYIKRKEVEENYIKREGMNTYLSYFASPKTVVEQEILLNEPFIATSVKNIYKAGEKINLLFYGRSEVALYVEYFDVNGSMYTENLSLKSDSEAATFYSTTEGIKGISKSYLITPQINNGWVDIEVKPGIGKRINIPVFIEDSTENNQQSEVLFVESTDTLNAYVSAYGLPIYYERGEGPFGGYTSPVSKPQNYNIHSQDKNINCTTHITNADIIHKKFLRTLKVQFKAVADNYLDDFRNFKNAKLLIFGAHNEYWTLKKAKNVQRFIEEGGNALFLGGNTAWRAVKRTPDFNLIYGDSLLNEGFGDFINQILGSYWDFRGFKTFAPFDMVDSDFVKSYFFDNEDYEKTFGVGTDFEHCSETILGASGHETDKLLPTAHPDFIRVAQGQNPDGGAAEVVFREFSSGGSVLNFGSISLWHRLSDENIKTMITQFIENALN